MQSVDGNLTDLESRAFLTAEMPMLLSILGNIATTSQETSKHPGGRGPEKTNKRQFDPYKHVSW